LKLLCPSLWNSCKKWEKNYIPQHATSFTMEDLTRLHTDFKDISYPVAFYRAYSVVACSFAARSGEPKNLRFENFEARKDKDGKRYFQLSYKRSKQTGSTNEIDTFCLINGAVEVEAIINWMSFFDEHDRTGYFFRYVRLKSDGKWRATKEVICHLFLRLSYEFLPIEYWE
jgi:hypothetical protein